MVGFNMATRKHKSYAYEISKLKKEIEFVDTVIKRGTPNIVVKSTTKLWRSHEITNDLEKHYFPDVLVPPQVYQPHMQVNEIHVNESICPPKTKL